MLDTDKLIAKSYADAPAIVRDFMAIQAGIKLPHAPSAIARELADLRIAPMELIEPLAKAKALSASDFAEITTQLVHVVESNFPEPLHRMLWMHLEASDYREQAIIAGMDDVSPESTIDEGGVIPTARLYNLYLEKTQIKRHASRLIVGYEVILNRSDWLNTVPPGVLQSVYRDEGADLFELLESNPNMEDGQPVFGAGNSVVGTTFSALLALFRSQKVRNGERVLGAEPRYIITPADQEIAMRTAIKQADMTNIEVIARADVVNSYLIADKSVSPTIFRVGLSDKPSLDVLPVPRSPRDVAVTCSASYQFAIGSRYGLCRMTPA